MLWEKGNRPHLWAWDQDWSNLRVPGSLRILPLKKEKGRQMLTTSSPCLGRTTLFSYLRILQLLLQGGSFPPFDVIMTPKEDSFSSKFLSIQITFGQGPQADSIACLGTSQGCHKGPGRRDYNERHSGTLTTAFAIPNTIISIIILCYLLLSGE